MAFYPEIEDVHYYLALAHVVAEDYENALVVLNDAVEHFDSDDAFLAYIGYVHALAGNQDAARRILDELIRRINVGESKMFASRPIRGIVRIYVALDEKDEAFSWLNQLSSVALVLDMYRGPWFKPLHDDFRWTELRKRAGLESLRCVAFKTQQLGETACP